MDSKEEEEEKVVNLPLLKLGSHYALEGVKYGCIGGIAISPIVSKLKLPVPKACKYFQHLKQKCFTPFMVLCLHPLVSLVINIFPSILTKSILVCLFVIDTQDTVYDISKDPYYIKSNGACIVSAFIFHKFLFKESLQPFKFGRMALGYASGAILYEAFHRVFE
jgi:hypothetical protein